MQMIPCQNSRCGTPVQFHPSTADARILCHQCGHLFSVPHAPDTPSFVIFDLETTGLCSETCEIIQIAAVRFKDGRAMSEDSFFSYCRPRRPVPGFITSYTGITDRQVRNAPAPIDVLRQFSEFVGDSVIMAHNGHRFDNKFLNSTCVRHAVQIREVESIDTIAFSRKLFGTARGTGHSLDRMMQRLGLSASSYQRHDARGDIMALADAMGIIWQRLGMDPTCKGISRSQAFLPALTKISG
jgi:DNA polymerase III subunit epsilon